MRILVVGAGGVGAAVAADRAAPRLLRADRRSPTSTRRAPQAVVDRLGDDRFAAAQRRRLRRGGDRRARSRERRRRDPERVRPALQPADLRGRVRRRLHLPRHGDDALEPHPSALRGAGVMLGDAQFAAARALGGARACSRSSGSASSRGSPTSSRATRPTTSSRRSTRSACATAPNLVVDGYDFAPTFSIWTTIEECLNPPLDLGARARLVHDRAVLRAGGVRLPGGHRPGRVRQRRARGGRARPALGRLQPRHVQVRARRRVHRRAARRCTSSGSTRREPVRVRGVEVAPRDVVAAALPDPATLGDRMHGQDLRRHARHRHRQGRRAARDLPLPRRRQRADDARVRPPGGRAGRPRSTRSSRSSCSRRAPGTGTGVLGPEAFDAAPFLDLLAEYGAPHGIVERDPRIDG